jgi:hypothetical protein
VIVGPAAGAAIDPITAALAALAVVGTCALYTLFILPESLSPQAIEAVSGLGGQSVGTLVQVAKSFAETCGSLTLELHPVTM